MAEWENDSEDLPDGALDKRTHAQENAISSSKAVNSSTDAGIIRMFQPLAQDDVTFLQIDSAGICEGDGSLVSMPIQCGVLENQLCLNAFFLEQNGRSKAAQVPIINNSNDLHEE
ncbi:hypothetical protein VNO78_08224 [Psophocarpus tetragonolobus]|uniref:Uncharacterized protein n=1 Tax=Psophocarpus tetragonolobus TaxID=3891 RepID=A0AAN9XTI6_PSOTE